MKVCLINYRYFVSSGPERYLFGVKDLLEERGHEVVPFSVRYRANEPTPWDKYFVEPIAGDDEVRFRQHSWTPASVRRALERSFYSREVYDALSAEIRDAKPDVAYVLHYMRKLSPAVLQALHDNGVPIAVRFSDFAMVCPQAHLIRDDQVCELCVHRSLLPSVRHRCVQGSLGASAVNAAAMYYAAFRGYFGHVDAFVAPSQIMRQKMMEGGISADRLHLLPTFVRPREMRPFAQRRSRICYAGRVERIKGVHVLLAAFARLRARGVAGDVELVIAGDLDSPCGRDIQRRLRERPLAGVTLTGQLPEADVIELMQSSLVSVVPSMWYENSPNSLLESLACGTPVIASDLGSMRDALSGTGAGLLSPPGDEAALAAALEAALGDAPALEEMGRVAHELAATRHSPATHVDGLLELFSGLRSHSGRP
jgi:glycosyltransferase involved in cell wall biosynthesis